MKLVKRSFLISVTFKLHKNVVQCSMITTGQPQSSQTFTQKCSLSLSQKTLTISPQGRKNIHDSIVPTKNNNISLEISTETYYILTGLNLKTHYKQHPTSINTSNPNHREDKWRTTKELTHIHTRNTGWEACQNKNSYTAEKCTVAHLNISKVKQQNKHKCIVYIYVCVIIKQEDSLNSFWTLCTEKITK